MKNLIVILFTFFFVCCSNYSEETTIVPDDDIDYTQFDFVYEMAELYPTATYKQDTCIDQEKLMEFLVPYEFDGDLPLVFLTEKGNFLLFEATTSRDTLTVVCSKETEMTQRSMQKIKKAFKYAAD